MNFKLIISNLLLIAFLSLMRYTQILFPIPHSLFPIP